MAETKDTEVKRVSRFGIVGIINTLIDFSILNLLRFVFGLTTIQANLVSTTFAMTFSFFANKHVVFKEEKGSIVKQALVFFGVTAFGLYILQSLVIYTLTNTWLWPGNFAVEVVHMVRLEGFLKDTFVKVNTAKAAAIAVSMVWNYVMYKKVVFKK